MSCKTKCFYLPCNNNLLSYLTIMVNVCGRKCECILLLQYEHMKHMNTKLTVLNMLKTGVRIKISAVTSLFPANPNYQ